MSIMLLLCVKQQLASFVDEMDDWRGEGAKTLLYGVPNKASVGFILLQWAKPIPPRFRQKVRDDPDVIDYFVIGPDILITLE